MVIFHSYVNLPEGTTFYNQHEYDLGLKVALNYTHLWPFSKAKIDDEPWDGMGWGCPIFKHTQMNMGH